MTTLATKGNHNLLRTLITSYSPTFLSVYHAQHHNWQMRKRKTQSHRYCYSATRLVACSVRPKRNHLMIKAIPGFSASGLHQHIHARKQHHSNLQGTPPQSIRLCKEWSSRSLAAFSGCSCSSTSNDAGTSSLSTAAAKTTQKTRNTMGMALDLAAMVAIQAAWSSFQERPLHFGLL